MRSHLQKMRLGVSHAFWNAGRASGYAYRVIRSRAVACMLILAALAVFYGRYITDLNLFIFWDDGRMIVHETYTSDALKAMEEAGIYIGDLDSIRGELAPIRGSLSEIVIERSYRVTVHYDGRSFSVPTQGETVASILWRTEFEARFGDVIVPEPGEMTYDGMEIYVYRSSRHEEVETEALEYETIIHENANMNNNTRVVTQEGISGMITYTYEVITVEGGETMRALVSTEVVEPVSEIIEVGTRQTVKIKDGTILAYSRKLNCTATAYTTENRTKKTNAIGAVARKGTIAVDPKVIPLRSYVYVVAANGKWEYGVARCEDTGGFRSNHVDLFFDTYYECIQFGKRKCVVYLLIGEGR